ncbi:MAG: dTDP-glucose 4,6-dehydratase [Candidatus Omnitrophica bacterium]|nr:dTDP-glucose 4,6-dehydratase [Candidatus Omnitrophota bacterium]
MKQILVTGGAGFIGSNFVRYFLKNYSDYTVINLDKLTYAGNRKNLRGFRNHHNYHFIKGDICNKKLVEETVKNCECVINFAAETHVDKSIDQPGTFIRTNINGVQTLLKAVNKFKVSRFIQISTDEVYGSIPAGSSKEEDPLRPSSPYSASKAAADLLCWSYYVTYNTPILIARCSNNYGEHQYPEKIIPFFVARLLRNRKVPLYGDGMHVRDWIYVGDCCRAIDLIRKNGETGQIYNVAGGNLISNLELAVKIIDILGKSREVIEFVEDRPGHDDRYMLSIEKIRQLGFSPDYDFAQTLEETVNWYRNNRQWWKFLNRKKIKERITKNTNTE